ncbi:MAG: hypothetical protein P8X57_16580, partial [Cyclobacteriaceae bacterium]
PKKTMRDLFEFLNVDPDIEVDFSVEHNRSGIIRNKFYDRTIGSNSVIKKFMKSILPDELYFQMTRSPKIKKITQGINNANLKPVSLDSDLFYRITNEIYGEEITDLEELIGRDLSHWRIAKPENAS